jgi:hypothetical protein
MTFAADDPALFFEDAEDALYDGDTAMKAHLDREYLEPLTGIAGSNPVALVQTSALPDANPVGKTLAIGGTTFVIKGREPMDDGAITRLQLVTQ